MKVIMNMNESIMDSIKGIGKKVIDGVKNAFKEKPKVTVTNTYTKQQFTAYVNDYDEKKDICEMIIVDEANESLMYSAIQAAQSAASNGGSSSSSSNKQQKKIKKFNVGRMVIVNGEGFDNEEGKVIEDDIINDAEYISVQFGE